MAFLHSDHQVAIKPQQQQGFFLRRREVLLEDSLFLTISNKLQLTTHILDRTTHPILENGLAPFHLQCTFLHDTGCGIFDTIAKLTRPLWISGHLKMEEEGTHYNSFHTC